jgi:hypothetical protein
MYDIKVSKKADVIIIICLRLFFICYKLIDLM